MIKLVTTDMIRSRFRGGSVYYACDSRLEKLKLGDYVFYTEYCHTSYSVRELVVLCKVFTDGIVDVISGHVVKTDIGGYIFKVRLSEDMVKRFTVLRGEDMEVGNYRYNAYIYSEFLGKDRKAGLSDYFLRECKPGDFVYFINKTHKWDSGILLSSDTILTSSLSKCKADYVLVYKNDELTQNEIELTQKLYQGFQSSVHAVRNNKVLFGHGKVYTAGSKLFIYLNPFTLEITDGNITRELKSDKPAFLELSKDTTKIDVFSMNFEDLVCQAILRSIHSRNKGSIAGDKYSIRRVSNTSDISCIRYSKPNSLNYVCDMDMKTRYDIHKMFKYKGITKEFNIRIQF